MTKAFLTGSQVYGAPTAESDLDLVILAKEDAAATLWEESDAGLGLRFGRLNIICLTDQTKFHIWKSVTESLRDTFLSTGKPVTRDEAVAAFQEAGISREDYNLGGKNGKSN